MPRNSLKTGVILVTTSAVLLRKFYQNRSESQLRVRNVPKVLLKLKTDCIKFSLIRSVEMFEKPSIEYETSIFYSGFNTTA
jgi:hypothetical protein